MKVRDLMTKSVAYVNPTTSVTEAATLMQKHNVGSIPVCESNKIVGIITDRDIVVRNIAHGKNPAVTSVKDVMTTQVTTGNPDMDISQATRLMADNQIRRLPIVENNNLVGMLALGDIAVNTNSDTEASEALSEISEPTKPGRY